MLHNNKQHHGTRTSFRRCAVSVQCVSTNADHHQGDVYRSTIVIARICYVVSYIMYFQNNVIYEICDLL